MDRKYTIEDLQQLCNSSQNNKGSNNGRGTMSPINTRPSSQLINKNSNSSFFSPQVSPKTTERGTLGQLAAFGGLSSNSDTQLSHEHKVQVVVDDD